MSETKHYGMYQGVVVDVKDTEKRGRIRVSCPDLNIELSAWCDPVVPVAYDNGGDFYVPPVDELVWLMFIRGDPNFPVYLGGWWQEGMTPVGDSYNNVNDVRIIKFADCAITMRDDSLLITVDDSDTSFEVNSKGVTIKGDLTLEGNLIRK